VPNGNWHISLIAKRSILKTTFALSKHRKVKYTDEPIGKIRIVSDFLPSPDDLVIKEEMVKVTLSLTKESVEFFKKEADTHHTSYQKMIRNLLDQYTAHYKR
jgi:hypothetical protein